jgi:hypothetical protein
MKKRMRAWVVSDVCRERTMRTVADSVDFHDGCNVKECTLSQRPRRRGAEGVRLRFLVDGTYTETGSAGSEDFNQQERQE